MEQFRTRPVAGTGLNRRFMAQSDVARLLALATSYPSHTLRQDEVAHGAAKVFARVEKGFERFVGSLSLVLHIVEPRRTPAAGVVRTSEKGNP